MDVYYLNFTKIRSNVRAIDPPGHHLCHLLLIISCLVGLKHLQVFVWDPQAETDGHPLWNKTTFLEDMDHIGLSIFCR